MSRTDGFLLIPLLSLSLVCLSNSIASADERRDEIFTGLDQNRDGLLTASEMNASQKPHFERLIRVGDRDADGQLTKAEYDRALTPPTAPAAQGRAEQFRDRLANRQRQPIDPERFFNFFDRDKDGKVALSEIPEPIRPRMKPMFDALMTNEISKREYNYIVGFARQKSDEADDSKMEIKPQNKSRQPPKAAQRPAMSRPDGRMPSPAGIITQFDKNGDGKLLPSEAPERMRDNFSRFDADKDGYINEADLKRIFRPRD